MLQFFRNFFGNKIGVIITLTFVAILGVGFALGSVSGTSFGGFGGGGRIATVGDEKISETDLDNQFRSILSRLRQRNPALSVKEFLAKDGLNEVLLYAMDGRAVTQWGEKHGIYIGDRLIDSEIGKEFPNLQAPDGKVDPALYRAMLAGQGNTDKAFRTEQSQILMARLLTAANSIGLKVPHKVASHYVAVITEHRRGAIVQLPPAAFAPAAAPTDAEITSWYNAHKGDYTLPERRTIRYVTFTDAAVKSAAAPSDAEVAARYNENKAKYAAADKRTIAQLVVPSEAAGKDILAAVSAGKTLEAAAQAKGYSVAPLGSVTKEAYVLQSSPEVADAVFSAGGKIVGPLKAPLGWVIVRIDARATTPGKTLEQAKPELVKELSDEKRKIEIAGYGEKIEGEIDNGATIGDLAKELNLTVTETPPLTANGMVYGQIGATAPAELARAVPAAFQMDGAGQPQLAEVEAGKTFIIYDVGNIAPAAPPPLTAIRAQVAEDARVAKGEAAAKAAADKIKAQVEKGVPIDVAVASLGVAVPPVDHVDMDRQVLQKQGKNASRPLHAVRHGQRQGSPDAGRPQPRLVCRDGQRSHPRQGRREKPGI
ncbi:MAG: SurA N-terminal domain-containing protein [Novosphingobium sp.]